MKNVFVIACGLLACAGGGAAQAELLIAYTSFEEPVIPLDVNNVPVFRYDDPGDPALDHELVNVADKTPVMHTSIGGELGFRSFYTNTRSGVGLTDDGTFGVVSTANSNLLAPPDGTQRFLNGGADGLATIVLDSVNLAGTTAPKVSLQAWFRSSTYEWVDGGEMDYFRIWVELNDGMNTSIVTLLDTRPNDIDDLNLEGPNGPGNIWNPLMAALAPNTVATLKFEVDCNNAAEMLGIDDIRFTDVPEPNSVMLTVVGLLTAAIVRIRRGRD